MGIRDYLGGCPSNGHTSKQVALREKLKKINYFSILDRWFLGGSLNPQLFKNIAYVGSLNHFSFQSFFTCNLHFDQEQHYQQCQAVIVPKHFHTLHEWNLDVYPPFNWIGPVTQEEIWAIANSCNSPFQTLNV